MLDTGNSMRYPLMGKSVYNELKAINVIKNDVELSKSGVPIKAINNKLYTAKKLQLKTPLTFLTTVGSEIRLQNFYVQDEMISHINIGKYSLSELGVKWDLRNNFVYIHDEKIPLISYE